MNIDWHSSKNDLFLNPRFNPLEAKGMEELAEQASHLRGHVFLTTSGSTRQDKGEIKVVALSKSALLTSAAAVNHQIQSGPEDIWIHTLPSFHVGGIGIWARSHLSRAKVVDLDLRKIRWNPPLFHQRLEEAKGTLVSLVPTQVYDLIQLRLRAPASLRVVIVGGGHLGRQLYFSARELGWNILPSYGMTECSSQIATAELSTLEKIEEYPRLKLLECFEAKVDPGTECLTIKGEPLLTGYCIKTSAGMQFVDPKMDGWFVTEDRGTISDGYIAMTDRRQDFIKISGESVSLARLDRIIEEIKFARNFQEDLAIILAEDDRRGQSIRLAIAGAPSREIAAILTEYNSLVLPFERIDQIHSVNEIPRTSLGKFIRHMSSW